MPLARPGNGIGKHQTAFSVGIIDLYRQAITGPGDAARLHGGGANRVFRQRQYTPITCTGSASSAMLSIRPRTLAAPPYRTSWCTSRRLPEPQSAGIKGDAFTDVAANRALADAIIMNRQQARRAFSALPTACSRPSPCSTIAFSSRTSQRSVGISAHRRRASSTTYCGVHCSAGRSASRRAACMRRGPLTMGEDVQRRPLFG